MDPLFLFPFLGSFVLRRLEKFADQHADVAAGYVAALLRARFGPVSKPHRDEMLDILRKVHAFNPERYPILDAYLRRRLQAFQQDCSGLNAQEPQSTCGFYELYDYFLHPVLNELERNDDLLKVHAGNVIRDYLSPRFQAYVESHRSHGTIKQLFVFDEHDLKESDAKLAQVITDLQNENVEVRFTSWPEIHAVDRSLLIQDVNIALCTKNLNTGPSTVCVRYVEGRPGFPRGRISATQEDILHARGVWRRFFEQANGVNVWRSRPNEVMRDVQQMKQHARELSTTA